MLGFNLSDLIIMPKCDLLSETLLTNDCLSYKEYIDEGINYHDKTYALEVYSLNKNYYLKEYAQMEINTSYYLLINNKSYHYKNYIKNDESILKTTIDLLTSIK